MGSRFFSINKRLISLTPRFFFFCLLFGWNGARVSAEVLATIAQQQTTPMTVQEFVHQQGELTKDRTTEQESDMLWVINAPTDTEQVVGDEMLFVVDTMTSPAIHDDLCRRSRRPRDCAHHDHHEECDIANSLPVLGIIGYIRPGVMERFCLWHDGWITSLHSRKHTFTHSVRPAPTLQMLVETIARLGPSHTCVPPAPRGVFFETMELLCFALGYKPAVIRQRQVHHGKSGGLLLGVPANLFVPHTRTLLTWLVSVSSSTSEKKDTTPDVWRGISKVEWDDPHHQDARSPPFEHSIIFTRNLALLEHLMELRVQDASVPHQESMEATAYYIAHVGAALGYSQEQVRLYLETAGVIPQAKDDAEQQKILFDRALAKAYDNAESSSSSCSSSDGEGECQQQPFAEIPGFRSFLDSEQATHLSTKSFHQIVEPLDDLFFFV